MQNHTYSCKFSGNFLIVGWTECGKTTFMQKLALHNFFGKLKKAEWISGISLTKKREPEIQTNFSCEVDFYYPADEDEFDAILEVLKSKSRSDEGTDNNDYETNVNNVFGENSILDRLFVFDDVSGLADNSEKCPSFLTVAPKYNYNCVYIFHTIYPEKENWRTVLLQKNIYNIFLPTVPLNSVRKILEGACIRKASKYIPQASHFIELANRNDKACLTLDCSNTNKDGPGRFWTAADNPDFQSCYFNSANDEQVYNEFISERVKNDVSHDNFYFKISELKSKTNKEKTFNASNKLRQLSKNDAKRSKSRTRTSFGAGSRSSGLSADRRNGLPNFDSTSGDVSSDAAKKHNEKFKKELNQDFFSSDNVIIPKKTIKKRSFNNYSPTKVKARNVLTNILYNRVKDEDFNNRSFIIDCYSFILLYLNPFHLDQKFENSVEKDYVEALWQLQIPNDFYAFICRPENYKILNKLELKFQETSEIVKTYVDDLVGYQ